MSYIKITGFIIISLFLFSLSIVAEETTLTKNILVHNYINALGGHANLVELNNRYLEGRVITDFRSRPNPEYYENTFHCYANKSNIRISYTRDLEEFSDDTSGLMDWYAENILEKEDSTTWIDKLDFFLNPQGPRMFHTYFPNLIFVGEKTLREKSYYALEPEGLSPEHYTLYFDKESFLLVSIGQYWEITDYKEIDGVLFPHKFLINHKGGSIVYTFEKVEHNVEIDESVFGLPTGK